MKRLILLVLFLTLSLSAQVLIQPQTSGGAGTGTANQIVINSGVVSLSSTLVIPGSVTASAAAWNLTSATVALPAPWVATNAVNTFSVAQIFTPGTAFYGLGIGAGIANVNIAGGLYMTAGGRFGWDTGANIQHAASFAGSGVTPPTAITPGKCLEAGASFTIVVAASNAACGSGAVANYYTSTVSTGVGPTSFTPNNTFRVYDATSSTGSTNMFVSPGAGQSGNLQVWQIASSTPGTASANDVGVRLLGNGTLDFLLGNQSDFAKIGASQFVISGTYPIKSFNSHIIVGGGAELSVRGRIFSGEGNAPTVSGCGATSPVSGFANAGVISGITTTGSCTLTLTPGTTADTGFSCSVNNQVTANSVRQTASNTTTATLVGVTVSGDTWAYQCQMF